MTTTSNDQSPERRRRNRHVAEIERLINQSRAIRIALSPFINHALCGQIAKEAVTSLQDARAKLEQLAELTVAAGSRRRRRSNQN